MMNGVRIDDWEHGRVCLKASHFVLELSLVNKFGHNYRTSSFFYAPMLL